MAGGLGRKVWTRETVSSAELQGYLQDQVVMRFATSAARDVAIPQPQEGMICTLDDTDEGQRHDGTAWRTIWNARPARMSMAAGWDHAVNLNASPGYERLATTGAGTEARIRGVITNTTALTAGTATQLVGPGVVPSALRPTVPILRTAESIFTTGNFYPHRVEIAVDGSMTMWPGANFGAGTLFSLDVSYSTKAAS